MYPSNSFNAGNNSNDENLTSPYTFDQNLLNKSSIYEINPSSKQGSHLHSPLYFNNASPCNLYENDGAFVKPMYDLYFYQRSQTTKFNAPDPDRTEMNSYNIEERLGESSSKQNKSEVIKEMPEKKISKKDRHSKIETAQGLRDRRVRLSLQVARDFFDLQDTLGYTRASKTVEWLLSNSKEAVKDVTSSSANSPFSTFECEAMFEKKDKHLGSSIKETKTTRGSTRKHAFNPLAKESRKKARARAIERTKERLKVNDLNIGSETTIMNETNSLGYWGQSQNQIPQLKVFGNVGDPISSMIFDYHTHSSGISHEYESQVDVHFLDKDTNPNTRCLRWLLSQLNRWNYCDSQIRVYQWNQHQLKVDFEGNTVRK